MSRKNLLRSVSKITQHPFMPEYHFPPHPSFSKTAKFQSFRRKTPQKRAFSHRTALRPKITGFARKNRVSQQKSSFCIKNAGSPSTPIAPRGQRASASKSHQKNSRSPPKKAAIGNRWDIIQPEKSSANRPRRPFSPRTPQRHIWKYRQS